MTIEEKARAYDEAVKKAQCWLNDPQTIQDCNYTIEDAIQNIFPVLAKNEDEMIRKELINWINGKTTYEWSYEWCENKDRWIAYLEKQKEQKPDSLIYDKDLDKAAREFYLSGGAASPVDSTGLVPIVRMAEFGATWMKERMEKEQKPAEWGELQSEFKNINEAFEDGKKEVVAHPEKYGLCECVPAEWGEKDEKKLKETLALVETIEDINKAKDGFLDVKIWLESLPERFVLQPKEEWSKEDEEIFNNIIEKAKGGYWIQMDEIAWLIARFKSLRPQPKPEWNEEDEKMRQSIIKDIEFERNYTSSTTGKVIGKYNEQINWLKSLPLNLKKKNEDAAKLCSNEWSDEDEEALDMCLDAIPKRWKTKSGILLTKWLKDNIRPQSKQEWSEEDRDTLLMAATVLKANFDSDEKFEDCDYDCGTFAGKLLEMRYRIGSSWKPSEEELRTLDIVITDYRHACTKGSDEKAETLKPLLEQLRKL